MYPDYKTESIKDISFLECALEVDGDDIWTRCKHDFSTMQQGSDIFSFDFENQEDKELKINISLKK
jgi:hypothetical protein